MIEAEKKTAQLTDKNVKGYQPILGFIAENSLVLAHEFREGNVPAQAEAVEFLDKCEKACPQKKKITYIRSDSAFYQTEVFKRYEENGKRYTVTADKDRGVKEAIKTIMDWKELLSPEEENTGREVGTAIHIMNKTDKAFRLVVQRWKNEQMDLFSLQQWCYQAISTNMDELEAEEAVWWHKRTIATIRWRLVGIAGKVVRHGRQVIMKLVVPMEKLQIFLQIREKCLGFG